MQPHLRLRDPEHERRHQQAHDVRVLRGHPDRVLARRRLVGGRRAANLNRGRDQPLVDEPLLDHDLRLAECLIGRVRVAYRPIHDDVAGCVLVQLDRTLGNRLFDVDDDVERLPVDFDQLERILGRVLALGHDRGDTGAGEGDAIDLERPRRVDEVLDTPRLPRARQRRQVLEVLSGEDGDDTRSGGGLRRVDALDPGMRVRGAEDRHLGHPRQLEIVEVLRGAGDQARVLDTPDGLADELGGCFRSRRHRATSAASWTARTMFS